MKSTLSDASEIRKWTNNGLPVDDFAIENALILRNSIRSCLLIDPQEMAIVWLKNIEQENGLIVIRIDEINLIETLKISISTGRVLIVDDIGIYRLYFFFSSEKTFRYSLEFYFRRRYSSISIEFSRTKFQSNVHSVCKRNDQSTS